MQSYKQHQEYYSRTPKRGEQREHLKNQKSSPQIQVLMKEDSKQRKYFIHKELQKKLIDGIDYLNSHEILQQQAIEMQNEIQQLHSEKREYEQILVKIKENEESLQFQFLQISEENKSLKFALEELHTTHSLQMQNQDSTYQSKKCLLEQQYSSQLKQANQESSIASRKLEQCEKKCDQLAKDQLRIIKENKELRQANLEHTTTIESLQNQLQFVTQQKQSEITHIMQHREQSLQNINNINLKEKDSILQAYHKLEINNSELNQQIVHYQNQYNSIQELYSNSQQGLVDFQQQIHQLKQNEAYLIKQNQNLQATVQFQTNLKSQLQDKISQINQQQQQIDQLNQKLYQYEVFNNQMRDDKQRLQQTISHLEAQSQSSRRTYTLPQQNQQLSRSFHKAQNERTSDYSPTFMHQNNNQYIPLIREAAKLSPKKIIIKTVN